MPRPWDEFLTIFCRSQAGIGLFLTLNYYPASTAWRSRTQYRTRSGSDCTQGELDVGCEYCGSRDEFKAEPVSSGRLCLISILCAALSVLSASVVLIVIPKTNHGDT